ncbi:hypothetical protein O6H91_09G099800 [Diphasiastrum complanatum]|uniref:Uncharacterized protein n=1 Tax=Diphasiastrum complanatum TaxID=34168 RepID=A0ACC2CSV6_DIPCM|nr:hypothetical protein O6H91_09G099800 [Diphasiastrum complanatum]
MYAIRRQTMLYDENQHIDAKGAMEKAGGGPLATQMNNRRAFGDIGNLVGDLSVRCNVSKNVTQEPVRATEPNSYGCSAQQPLAASVSDAEKFTAWGAKQRRTLRDGSTATFNLPRELTNSTFQTVSQPVRRNRISPLPTAKKQEATLISRTAEAADCAAFDLEMLEVYEEALPDIDQADAGNHLAVAEYVQDLYGFYRICEAFVFPDYMSKQADINEKMRAILVDWLIEVHLKFKLMPETLFLTMNLIDRYLSAQNVSRRHLQLVGVTAMLLAAKYEEIWAPEVQDFVVISDGAYTRDQVLAMEKKILNTLSFNLTVPTPYMFIVRFLKAASADRQLNLLAFFLLELCLVEYAMVKFTPSMLAAAAVYTAQCTLKKIPSWNYVLQSHTGYKEGHLKECAGMIVGFHQKAAEGNLTVVHKKYASSKFSSVSMLHPASWLQEEEERESCMSA